MRKYLLATALIALALPFGPSYGQTVIKATPSAAGSQVPLTPAEEAALAESQAFMKAASGEGATQPAPKGQLTKPVNSVTPPQPPQPPQPLQPPAPAQVKAQAPQVPPPPAPAQPPQLAQPAAKEVFSPLDRGLNNFNQIQQAWNKADGSAGITRYGVCRDCTYKVLLREMMVTAIQLPAGTEIESVDLGDPVLFEVKTRSPNVLAVKPKGWGADTSLIIYDKAGMVYPFYLRTESINSANIPDLLVKIGDNGPKLAEFSPSVAALLTPKIVVKDSLSIEPSPKTSLAKAIEGLTPKASTASSPSKKSIPDFMKNVNFDPGKIRGFNDFDVAGDWPSRQVPARIFHDDRFTYIQWDDESWNEGELPTAFIQVDKIDEVVNTRVSGQTLIVESLNPRITLKSGTNYLCITNKAIS